MRHTHKHTHTHTRAVNTTTHDGTQMDHGGFLMHQLESQSGSHVCLVALAPPHIAALLLPDILLPFFKILLPPRLSSCLLPWFYPLVH